MIVLSRIDSRLIHGQVIEAWLPHLDVKRVVVADDESADDALAKIALTLAVPPDVEVVLSAVTAIDYRALATDKVRTLVLFRDVRAAVMARERGLPNGVLNVGNVHSAPGKREVTRSVFLDVGEATALGQLRKGGMDVIIQAVPNEKPAPLPPNS